MSAATSTTACSNPHAAVLLAREHVAGIRREDDGERRPRAFAHVAAAVDLHANWQREGCLALTHATRAVATAQSRPRRHDAGLRLIREVQRPTEVLLVEFVRAIVHQLRGL